MRKEAYIPLCSIKHCNIVAESLRLFGLELCFRHQGVINQWLVEKGYTHEKEIFTY